MPPDSDIFRAKAALEQELIRPLGQALAAYIGLWVRSETRIPFWEVVSARSAIEGVLMRHYARCCYVGRGIKPPREARLDDAALDAKHREELAARAHRQSLRMIQAIDRELAAAQASNGVSEKELAAHYETKADKDKQPWSIWLATKLKASAEKAWRKVKQRMRAIVNNETQEAIEGTIFRWVKQQYANARIYKRWETMQDERVRHPPKSAFDHVAAQGQEVLVSEPFIVSDERLMFPGDSALGASLGNLINCFPAGTRVSGFVRAATRHWYEGEIVEIRTAGGYQLSGTPNHPILTPKGWVALGALKEGDYLIARRRSNGARNGAGSARDVDDVEPEIEQVFDALARAGNTVRMPALAVDFHGDRPAQDVDIVRADRSLWLGMDAALGKHLHHLGLASAHVVPGLRPAFGSLREFFDTRHAASAFFVGRSREALAILRRRLGEPDLVGVGSGAHGQPKVIEALDHEAALTAYFAGDGKHRLASFVGIFDRFVERTSALKPTGGVGLSPCAQNPSISNSLVRRHYSDPHDLGDLVHALAGAIQIEKVTDRFVRKWFGHVFNLETVHGLYHANGILASNCRCSAQYVAVGPDGRRIDIPIRTPHLPARRTWRPGDKPGAPTPIRATEAVTLNGTTNARVVLGDGRTIASMRQETPSTLVVRIGRQVVARARVNTRTGTVQDVQVAAGREALGIEDLIRRSVTHSAEHLSRVAP